MSKNVHVDDLAGSDDASATEFTPEQRLNHVRKRVRESDFRFDLINEVRLLQEQLQELRKSDIHAFYKGLATCAQVLDYFGYYEDVRALVSAEGSLAYSDSLTWRAPKTDSLRLLMKEKIWLVMHYAKSFYRANDLTQARKIVEKCSGVLSKYIQSKADPCHRTWGYLEYLRGQIYRQMFEYDRASEAMNASLVHAHAKLDWFMTQPRAGTLKEWLQREQEERTWANRRIALALSMGLGWIHVTRGLPLQALPLLQAARILLYGTHDWVNRAYVDLLYGSAQRALAGFDPDRLKESIQILKLAYDVFDPKLTHGKSPGHKPYRGRAAYQLALAHLYAGKLKEAERFQAEMWQIASEKGDHRWLSHSLIVKSRIQRAQNNFIGALEAADEARSFATKGGQLMCEIDALIAGSEADLSLGKYVAARHKLQIALRDVHNNPQTEAVCHLRLAATWLGENSLSKAEEHFAVWTRVRDGIQNQVVHTIAESVREVLEEGQEDFTISHKTKKLKYEDHEKRLLQFLYKLASRSSSKEVDIAKRLGLSRTTLHNRLKKGAKRKLS
jgi:hypothetical protein